MRVRAIRSDGHDADRVAGFEAQPPRAQPAPGRGELDDDLAGGDEGLRGAAQEPRRIPADPDVAVEQQHRRPMPGPERGVQRVATVHTRPSSSRAIKLRGDASAPS